MSEFDASNPYQQPASVVVEQADDPRRLVPAGKWRRFFNWLVDYLAIIALIFVLTLASVLVGGEHALDWVEGLNGLQENLLGIAVMLVYYVTMEGLFGATVGKWVTRTRVVDERGLPPGWRAVFLRGITRFIPFEPLSLLFAETEDPRGWHDRLAKTRVVLRKLAPVRRSPTLTAL